MQIKKLSMMLLSALSCAALLNGCGSSSKEGSPATVSLVDEATCQVCHSSSIDPKSKLQIVPEYLNSPHAKPEVASVAGCQGCHGGGAQHNGVGPIPYPDPDAAGRCWNCHQPAFLGAYGAPSAAEQAHFQNITSYRVKYINPTSADKTTCTGCHEPHNPLTGLGAAERTAWAGSDHGNVAGTAWMPSSTHKWLTSGGSENFSQTIPASDCLRCHTADGYAQFAKSNYTSVANLPGDPKVNSALKCDACHNDDSFSVRGFAQVSTFYNTSLVDKVTGKTVTSHQAAVFPDVGNSNICISCHSGRTSGPNLTEMFNSGNWNLSNTSFQNSHYDAAAGTMYLTAGFKNFTTLTAPVPSSKEGATLALSATATYATTLTATSTPGKKGTVPASIGIPNGVTSSHRALGTPGIDLSEDYLVAVGTGHIDTNGPCVTCHMKADNPVAGTTNGVTFTPFADGRPAHGHSLQIDAATGNELCLQCHNDGPNLKGGDGKGNAITVQYQSFADLVSTQLEGQSAAFQNGLTLITQILKVKYAIDFDSTAYPYFFETGKPHTSANAITDWTRKNVTTTAAVANLNSSTITPIPAGGLSQAQAYRLMGACFNLNLLARDPGAYVHARTYTQRLVYDSVDFLDDNKMDFTSLTSARAMTTAGVAGLTGIYVGNSVNVLYADQGTDKLATESMAWLAGTHYTSSSGTTSPVRMNLRP